MSAALLDWLRDHGAPAIFLLIAIENVGVPWIAAPAFGVAAEVVRSGRMEFWPMVGLITCAHMFGATAAWATMRAGENVLASFFRRNEHLDEAYRWLCRWYGRRGALTLFGGRLFGQIRPWASLAAGMAGVRAIPFLFWTTLGSVAYSALLLYVWVTGVSLWANVPELRWLLLLVLAVALFGAAAYLAVRHVRNSSRRGPGVDEECAAE